MEAISRQVFATDHVKSAEHFAYWRESICEAFAALDPTAAVDPKHPFPSRVEVDPFPGGSLSLVQSQPQRVVRAPPQIRRDPRDTLLVNVMLAGVSVVEQGGCRSLVRVGDVYVVDTSRPYLLEHPEPFQLLCLNLPRDTMIGPGRPAPAFAESRSTLLGRGRLAMGLLWQLRREFDALQPEDRADALSVACGWLSAVLAARHGTSCPPALPLVDLWRRALVVVEARLRDPRLCPRDIAADLRVSLRLLHKAFAHEGVTVSGTVRAMRLERCAQELSRLPGRRNISAIAEDWGFADIPNFHRQFRLRYGHTPGDHRSMYLHRRGT